MKDSYLSDEELKAFIATLPTRRLAAGALIRNERGEMLLVKPNYKDGWDSSRRHRGGWRGSQARLRA